MATKILILVFTVLIYKTQAQLCGCGGPRPVLPAPVPTPVVAAPPVLTTPMAPTVITSPVLSTTLIDNSVSNSLANALQLLIVSDLIESTLKPKCCFASPAFIDTFSAPTCDIIAPVTEISPPCNQNVELITPGPFIETVNPNMCGGITEFISPIGPGPNMCGGIGEFISPIGPCSKMYGGVAEFLSPVGPCPNMYGGITEFISPVGPPAPLAAEVMIPASIPAQLTCNFGYVPTTLPCVSVNVEPVSAFEPCGCNNYFGNGYFL